MAFIYWYRAETEAIASAHRLDPDVVTAIAMTESSGHANAYRYEPNFWLRYMAGKPKWDGANPHRVSASYGLMQVMYTTALEQGFRQGDPPEFLFVPTESLTYGCSKLSSLLGWSKGDLHSALAAYNGGKKGNVPGEALRNQTYVDKVLDWLAKVQRGEVVAA